MNKIKAVFFDVDSTIYTHRLHDIPSSTKDTLLQLKQQGYYIGIATSRCQYEMKNLPSFFHTFPFDAMIFDGGALVIVNGEVIHKSLIEKEDIGRLSAYCEKEEIALRYSTIDGDYLVRPCEVRVMDEFFKLYLNMPMIKEYEQEEAFNLLAYPKHDGQIDAIRTLLPDVAIVQHSSSTLEITANGIDKSCGVVKVASKWGITLEEIVCFGDGANDVGMLKAAGIGIAMENGNPKAKEVADMICPHIDEDGVYQACKDLNLISF